MSQRKPLFSRNQLNLIILGSTLLIAILAWPPSHPPVPELHQIDGVPLYQQPSTSEQQHDRRLHLVFSLTGNQPFAPWQAQLLSSIIEQRIKQSAVDIPGKIELHHDRLSIQLQHNQATTLAEQTQRLIDLLQPVGNAEIEQQLQRLRAQQYLQRQQRQPSTGPWSDDINKTAALELESFRQQWFSRDRLQLVMTGELDAPLIKALEKLIDRLAPIPERSLTVQDPNTPDWQPELSLLPLPGRNSPAYPQSLMLSRVLNAMLNSDRAEFYSTAQQSWLVWPAHQPNFLPRFEKIKQQLGQLTEPQWQQLFDNYQQLLEQPPLSAAQQAQQLEVIARYRLPLDYRQQLTAKIAALTPKRMKLFIQQHFNTEYLSAPLSSESATQEHHDQKSQTPPTGE